MPRIIFGSSHLSRDREDFHTDYDTRWGADDEREWEDHDRDGDFPEDDE